MSTLACSLQRIPREHNAGYPPILQHHHIILVEGQFVIFILRTILSKSLWDGSKLRGKQRTGQQYQPKTALLTS